MKQDANQHVSLQTYASEAFLPLACSFVERTAIALGLGQPEALALTLATEEVFCHLYRAVLPEGSRVEIRCSGGGYYVQTDFTFPEAQFDMRAFNITATVSLADEASFEQMGLVLASRSVDRFQIVREEGQALKLTLVKEKAYPLMTLEPMTPVKPMEEFSIHSPSPEELKRFAHRVNASYRHQVLPNVFNYPGKLVDMVGSGRYHAALAVSPSNEIGGGTFWHWMGKRSVECFGPYLFNQKPDSQISTALLESCIGAIARSPARVLINRFTTPEFPRQDFELLGSVSMVAGGGIPSSQEAWFRMMHEDAGSVAWVHPELQPFVSNEYKRLVLPRKIRIAKNEGEESSPNSVLCTSFDQSRKSATLQPIWFGKDFEKNLVDHLNLFQAENILNIFFQLDLGQSWQADFTPHLLKNGFKPRLILPYAGTGDQVIFQYGLQGASS